MRKKKDGSKKLSALLYGITSKHMGGFYCLNCLHSFRTENIKCVKINIAVELQCHQKRIKYSNLINKMPYIIYSDMEFY